MGGSLQGTSGTRSFHSSPWRGGSPCRRRTATRPASSHSTRHSLKAEPGAGLTRAGLQGKEWARPPSSWGTETRCHPNAADPRGKPDRGATAVGRGPGGRPQGAQRPTPGHAHWQAQRPRARDSALCRGLLRPTTAHQASGRRRQLPVQPHGAMAKTTTWGGPGCAEAAVCAFKARASGPAPACPRGTVPPRPRSSVPGPAPFLHFSWCADTPLLSAPRN